MRITLYTDYALRTLIYLATHSGRRVPSKEVAQAFGVSKDHLLKVVHRLGVLGLVDVVRGQGGGMSLQRAPESITVGEIVRQFEPDLDLVECFDPARDACVISPACDLQGTLSRALTAFLQVLDDTTLADLLKDRRRALRRLLDAPEEKE